MLMWLFSIVNAKKLLMDIVIGLARQRTRAGPKDEFPMEANKYAKISQSTIPSLTESIPTYATIHTSAYSPHHYPRAEYY